MQNIIDQTRSALAPFVDHEERDNSPFAHMPMTTVGRDLFVKKIPKQNYKDLSRLVPISWL